VCYFVGMQLLNLTISNHKSIRDEATFDLTQSTLRTLNPSEGTQWDDHLHHVAGIYGPNGSGKTNLLEALHHMQNAIATLLPLGANALPYRPYDASKPTCYSVEFIHDDMRYEYSLSRHADGIAEERLRVARKRWNTIYSRDTHGAVTGLKCLPHVNVNELVLTRASLMGDPQAKPVRDALTTGVSIFRVGAPSMEDAYLHIARHLLLRRLDTTALSTLAQVADLGTTSIELHAPKRPAHSTHHTPVDREAATETSLAQALPHLLEFRYGARAVPHTALSASSGSIMWLALATTAVDALTSGQLLVVDDLTAYLHTELGRTIIDWFTDPTVNQTGAQLIFTTHDIALMDIGRGPIRNRERIWFTEKNSAKATMLYQLSDFTSLQARSNITKNYLEGRFGATTYTCPSLIHHLLAN
jgi:ABC-type lipoprotein export system ATPase subunit